MNSYESKLYKMPAPAVTAFLTARRTISSLHNHTTLRVLAPEHKREHRRLYSSRIDQDESVGRSLHIAENPTVLFRPSLRLLVYCLKD
jgi:hypothetical protein